jgi:hypothetical protein
MGVNVEDGTDWSKDLCAYSMWTFSPITVEFQGKKLKERLVIQ